MTQQTPAAEALEEWPGINPGRVWSWFLEHWEATQQALKLLDQIQTGQLKALRREPIEHDREKMLESAQKAIGIDGTYGFGVIYMAMWDAAPSTPGEQ